MIRRQFAALVLACLALGAGAACDPSGPAQRPAEPSPVATMSLPLDRLFPSGDEDLLLQWAEAKLVVACMRRLGISYRPPEPQRTDPAAARDGLYGLVKHGQAQRLGYHAASGGDPAEDKDPPLPKETAAALTGTRFDADGPVPAGGRIPEGGCLGEANRRLAEGGPSVGETLLYDMALQAGHQAEQDPRVQAGFRAWSTCMAGKGFVYADPWQANDDPRWSTDRPSDVERRTAVADVACKDSTGLVTIWQAAMVEHQRRTIASRSADIERYEQAKSARLANSRQVLATM
ncbi:hypothetical protein [Micromonospora sp. CB01531]|uniref:hypothetical protein n=1 Tax=Micromonospora sp. CB01531 TaxID=1718947 RepID=UPI00093D7469|nr:hypothetical protein [Micromonospora sp. CB01531]OKI53638.1 hypothetical protein A6A27_32375 [Micromonospora sp. CB01531]